MSQSCTVIVQLFKLNCIIIHLYSIFQRVPVAAYITAAINSRSLTSCSSSFLSLFCICSSSCPVLHVSSYLPICEAHVACETNHNHLFKVFFSHFLRLSALSRTQPRLCFSESQGFHQRPSFRQVLSGLQPQPCGAFLNTLSRLSFTFMTFMYSVIVTQSSEDQESKHTM